MSLTKVQSGMIGSVDATTITGVLPAANGGTGGTGGVTGFKNRIINGAQVFAQRGTSFTPSANTDTYTMDRWEASMHASTATYSVAQSAVVPNGNFTNSALLTVTSAASPSGSNYVFYQTKIEGYNMADLGWGTADAKTVTVSFWVRSSVTGLYSFHLINGSPNYSYVATFTISASNTWQYVTLTVPGPTTGTWNTTNGVGIYAGIDLGQGSSMQTTANTWTSGASFYCGTSSNVQWINNAGATMYVTAFQLEVGSSATTFDTRPFETEFQLCRRYYERSYDLGQATGSFTAGWRGITTSTATSGAEGPGWGFLTPKRTGPTVVLYNAVSGAANKAYQVSTAASITVGTRYVGHTGIGIIDFTSSGGTNSYYIHYTADAEL